MGSKIVKIDLVACSKAQIEDKYVSEPYMLILSSTNQYSMRNGKKKQQNINSHCNFFSRWCYLNCHRGHWGDLNQIGSVLYESQYQHHYLEPGLGT